MRKGPCSTAYDRLTAIADRAWEPQYTSERTFRQVAITGMSDELTGYRRAHGAWGARNHVLVLPSVVCAGLVAEQIATATHVIHISHQHGCGHIGDDITYSERAFLGIATNPNVGAVVVASLGCETIQGRRLAAKIADQNQRVRFVGIQESGGTAEAIRRGRAEAQELKNELAFDRREAMPIDAVTLGIDFVDENGFDLAIALAQMAVASGARVVLVDAGRERVAGLAAHELAEVDVGSPGIPDRPALIKDAGYGAEARVALALSGAQIVVSFGGRGSAPTGFAICPVVAIACDANTYAALSEDFDLDGSGPAATAAQGIWKRTLAVLNGDQSASERRHANDFALRRFARNM